MKKTEFQVLNRTRRMQIHLLVITRSRWNEEQGLRWWGLTSLMNKKNKIRENSTAKAAAVL